MSGVEDEVNVLTTLKILIIGDCGVGKSSLLLRFSEDKFDINQEVTMGLDFKHKLITIDDNVVRLAIWDTAGNERFRALTPNFYRGAQGVILVYDVTERSSFMKLEWWLNELETFATSDDIVKIVVGNKIDKENRKVTRDEGLQFAKRHATLFIESSAQTREGVQYAFEELVQKILQTPGLWQTKPTQSLQLSDDPVSSKQSWCNGWCGN
ncbi:ras-related protein Rab-18-B-like [Ischnura elegans]|uniref:ras-related protein Rab-18-B-like n=1 Tax=Ischnura elegans TaxID=197161 RepID=UPI001ED8787B|nr:ras-related protein Rab-18-B-like [Ischnura elegans]